VYRTILGDGKLYGARHRHTVHRGPFDYMLHKYGSVYLGVLCLFDRVHVDAVARHDLPLLAQDADHILSGAGAERHQ